MDTKLGKIAGVSFGHGGYQDVMIGLNLTLEGDGWGVCTNISGWDAELMECTERCKWTEEDRDVDYASIIREISKLLSQAKVSKVSDLKGVPIEATFEANTLKSWRILTEVI